MADIDQFVTSYRSGTLTGKALADLVVAGTITKTERRKIVKSSAKPVKEVKPLTQRQELRLAVKEKKAQPRLSKDDRRTKFTNSLALEKDKEREQEAANFTTCLGCRKRGHFLKDCPKVNKNSLAENVDICFNCGLTGHALRHCSKPRSKDGSLPFASCFICMKKGHISKDCAENPNGLYPKGGCCHICLQKTHLVRDCPERTEEDRLNHANKKQREAQEAEDIAEGPRVSGLTVSDSSRGADELDDSYFGDNNDDDDDEEGGGGGGKKSKKSSKESGSKKKRKL